jgi:hypothetical protein
MTVTRQLLRFHRFRFSNSSSSSSILLLSMATKSKLIGAQRVPSSSDIPDTLQPSTCTPISNPRGKSKRSSAPDFKTNFHPTSQSPNVSSPSSATPSSPPEKENCNYILSKNAEFIEITLKKKPSKRLSFSGGAARILSPPSSSFVSSVDYPSPSPIYSSSPSLPTSTSLSSVEENKALKVKVLKKRRESTEKHLERMAAAKLKRDLQKLAIALEAGMPGDASSIIATTLAIYDPELSKQTSSFSSSSSPASQITTNEVVYEETVELKFDMTPSLSPSSLPSSIIPSSCSSSSTSTKRLNPIERAMEEALQAFGGEPLDRVLIKSTASATEGGIGDDNFLRKNALDSVTKSPSPSSSSSSSSGSETTKTTKTTRRTRRTSYIRNKETCVTAKQETGEMN